MESVWPAAALFSEVELLQDAAKSDAVKRRAGIAKRMVQMFA